jgi:RNA-directed DNA polymerase
MTVNKTTGAAFGKSTAWMPIAATEAERNVRRLQTRIVKAAQEKRWGKVKALQRLLTCSLSGKTLAVKRVTDNRGSKTPGVDGIIWSTTKQKAEATKELKRSGYKPSPLRRIKIPKANGKMRPLGIPTMYDRAMQALHLQGLDPIAEVFSDRGSYGFRKERTVADAIDHCFKALSKKNSPQYILEADIKACFDRIDHAWLIQNVPMDKSILTKWLKA